MQNDENVGVLERGLDAFDRRSWNEAYEQLAGAERADGLPAGHLERLAAAAYLSGRDRESAEIWSRAHHAYVEVDDLTGALRCAYWLAVDSILRGEMAPAGGWIARAERLVDPDDDSSLARAYVLLPTALRSLFGGDAGSACAMFSAAAEIGRRRHDPDVEALALVGHGQSLIMLGETSRGVPLLDEAMVAVASDEVSPVLGGLLYCAVIDTCRAVFDLRRAAEWTSALSEWCTAQPDLVPYRGQCLIHRAEVLQICGEWADAAAEAEQACDRLADPPGQWALGRARYQRGELHRLRGEFAEAEAAFRDASRLGQSPQPGLALLRLANGDVAAAATGLRNALLDATERVSRPKLLAAAVETELAAGDLGAAQKAATELAEIAQALDAPVLHGTADTAAGAVRLAEGDSLGAREPLRRAWTTFHTLEAPYDAARVRVLLGQACRALGDEEGAAMELDAARWVFEQLGAAADLAVLDTLLRSDDTSVGGLTAREVEVLRLVAAGNTNRTIADELVISEKTVARHVSNIFVKLGVSSRSAATAYAYEHALV